MCRMLAKIALEPFSPAYELLDAPHSLRNQSKCGRQPDAPETCGPHASGCGIAWRNGAILELEKRGPDDRWDDSFCNRVRSLNTRALLGHNRLASPGLKIDVRTSHPFLETVRGIPVAFCHNGGIRTLMDEAKALGVTDSQIFFEKLIEHSVKFDHDAIAASLQRFANEWSFTSLSALILSPTALHVCRCYDENDSRRADFERYYTLWLRESSGEVTIASEAVDSAKEWRLIANRTLVSWDLSGPELQLASTAF